MNASAPRLPVTAILGIGSMGGAILQGLRAPGVDIETPIRVTTRSAESAAAHEGDPGVVARASETDPAANATAVRGARAVILGVKPWLIHDLLREISPELAPGTVVISVAAGVTLASMRDLVPAGVSVLRAMPNTPSLVGRGVTGITAGPGTPEADIALAEALFRTVGAVLTLESEAQIDALSAVSGSGPAYVFLFIELLTEAAVRLGFTREHAGMLAQETFVGSTLLLDHTGEDPAQLRRNVTSPQGTTEQAIREFQAAGLDKIFDRALGAAVRRAEELGQHTLA